MGQKELNWNQRENSSSYAGLDGSPFPALRLPKKPPVNGIPTSEARKKMSKAPSNGER